MIATCCQAECRDDVLLLRKQRILHAWSYVNDAMFTTDSGFTSARMFPELGPAGGKGHL